MKQPALNFLSKVKEAKDYAVIAKYYTFDRHYAPTKIN